MAARSALTPGLAEWPGARGATSNTASKDGGERSPPERKHDPSSRPRSSLALASTSQGTVMVAVSE